MREGGRQTGRHDAWDQERQPDEAEAVQDEQRPQRFGPLPEAEFRPDVSGGDDPPRDEAEYDAREKAELRQHERLLGWHSSHWPRSRAKRASCAIPPSMRFAPHARILRTTLTWLRPAFRWCPSPQACGIPNWRSEATARAATDVRRRADRSFVRGHRGATPRPRFLHIGCLCRGRPQTWQ